MNLPDLSDDPQELTNLADEIAYNSHDIDDGLRSGLLTMEQMQDLDFFARQGHTIVPSASLLPDYQKKLENATGAETAMLLLDEARDVLNAEDMAALSAAFEAKFPEA